jgi:hypothetical protein
MIDTARLERLAQIGADMAAPEGDLRAAACREIRRCARLGLRDTRVAHLYAGRAERLADLLAAGPQGRAAPENSERATQRLIRELAA